jgi:serine protease Do
MKIGNRLKIGLAGTTLAVAALGIGYGRTESSKLPEKPVASVSARAGVPMVPATFSDLAESVRPGVVNIRVVKKVQNVGFEFPGFPGGEFGNDSPFGRFFGGQPQMERKQEGVGSGFVISPDGFILTNNHVVEDADQIKVKLANGTESDARVVGRDPKTDLAVIKIEGVRDLHPLPLGSSDDLKVGSWVMAIGSPFGLEQTVTQGIVSGKGRVIGSGPYDDFIQTDASINPGNSGGPLINMKGEVIGINTAINPNGQGIGFAIPVDMARNIVPQLEKNGKVTRGWLGIGVQEMTPALEKSFGVKNNEGVLVADVYKGSPAEKAGIERGDVIVKYDGRNITDSKDLPRMVASTSVGKTVDVKLVRDGREMERNVTVGEMSDKTESDSRSERKTLGIQVQSLTPEIARDLGLRQETGVVVTGVEPGSAAADAGLRTGDVIQEVNRKPVRSLEDFSQKVEQAKTQNNVLFLIRRGDNSLFAAVNPK